MYSTTPSHLQLRSKALLPFQAAECSHYCLRVCRYITPGMIPGHTWDALHSSFQKQVLNGQALSRSNDPRYIYDYRNTGDVATFSQASASVSSTITNLFSFVQTWWASVGKFATNRDLAPLAANLEIGFEHKTLQCTTVPGAMTCITSTVPRLENRLDGPHSVKCRRKRIWDCTGGEEVRLLQYMENDNSRSRGSRPASLAPWASEGRGREASFELG